MSTPRKVRHAAREAYKLALYRGVYASTQLGLRCEVYAANRVVLVWEGATMHPVQIAKAWLHS